MLVISIQSQVVHGHVGNSAAAYAMQAEGVNVAAVPTTLLSNHPRYPTLRGRVLETELVADLLRGAEERDLVDEAAVLVTGYLGSPGNAAAIADFAERALTRNSKLVYVADGILDVVRHRLLPAANLITPNQFELELLSGTTISDAQGLRAACAALGGQRRIDVVATGCTLADTPVGQVETILCADGQLSRFATPRLPIRPSGTGDLLTGLIAAHLAKGRAMEAAVRLAVETVFAVLVRTQEAGTAEMRLVPLPTPGRQP
jgi:pyridoxine kinase